MYCRRMHLNLDAEMRLGNTVHTVDESPVHLSAIGSRWSTNVYSRKLACFSLKGALGVQNKTLCNRIIAALGEDAGAPCCCCRMYDTARLRVFISALSSHLSFGWERDL